MKKRYDVIHAVLGKMYAQNKNHSGELFGSKTTIHADLKLRWMKPGFQSRHIAPTSEFQIVIATIEPRTATHTHFHEIGASTFAVIDTPGNAPAEQIIYRRGRMLNEESAVLEHELALRNNIIENISSGQVHQFVNESGLPAQLLIVTNPVICLKRGREDTYYATFIS